MIKSGYIVPNYKPTPGVELGPHFQFIDRDKHGSYTRYFKCENTQGCIGMHVIAKVNKANGTAFIIGLDPEAENEHES